MPTTGGVTSSMCSTTRCRHQCAMTASQNTEPPVYDLEEVTTPTALYWSDYDYFAEPGVGASKSTGRRKGEGQS